MIYPWETPVPAVPVEDVVRALQRDVAYAVTHTGILVHSEHAALQMLVNTRRGQIVPRGECYFTDGTKFELQDIGMPQVDAPEMSVRELVSEIWAVAIRLGLELRK